MKESASVDMKDRALPLLAENVGPTWQLLSQIPENSKLEQAIKERYTGAATAVVKDKSTQAPAPCKPDDIDDAIGMLFSLLVEKRSVIFLLELVCERTGPHYVPEVTLMSVEYFCRTAVVVVGVRALTKGLLRRMLVKLPPALYNVPLVIVKQAPFKQATKLPANPRVYELDKLRSTLGGVVETEVQLFSDMLERE